MEALLEKNTSVILITPEQLLEQWQGHRRLTRRVIEAFPEDKFLNYSVGGMRPFAKIIDELSDLADAGITGIATGTWKSYEGGFDHTNQQKPTTKEDYLRIWDEITEKINELWKDISSERWQETDKAFGMYEAPVYGSLFYFIDNEIHHRGQGYVYLRTLGIEPPAFYER